MTALQTLVRCLENMQRKLHSCRGVQEHPHWHPAPINTGSPVHRSFLRVVCWCVLKSSLISLPWDWWPPGDSSAKQCAKDSVHPGEASRSSSALMGLKSFDGSSFQFIFSLLFKEWKQHEKLRTSLDSRRICVASDLCFGVAGGFSFHKASEEQRNRFEKSLQTAYSGKFQKLLTNCHKYIHNIMIKTWYHVYIACILHYTTLFRKFSNRQ